MTLLLPLFLCNTLLIPWQHFGNCGVSVPRMGILWSALGARPKIANSELFSRLFVMCNRHCRLAVGHLLSSASGALEGLIEQAGLKVAGRGEVDCPFEYQDLETHWRAQRSGGPLQAAIRGVGERPTSRGGRASSRAVSDKHRRCAFGEPFSLRHCNCLGQTLHQRADVRPTLACRRRRFGLASEPRMMPAVSNF